MRFRANVNYSHIEVNKNVRKSRIGRSSAAGPAAAAARDDRARQKRCGFTQQAPRSTAILVAHGGEQRFQRLGKQVGLACEGALEARDDFAVETPGATCLLKPLLQLGRHSQVKARARVLGHAPTYGGKVK